MNIDEWLTSLLGSIKMDVCENYVMVIIIGNEYSKSSSNPGQSCISLHANVLVKGMNLSILATLDWVL